MIPGVAGVVAMVMVLRALEPQALFAFTDSVPPVNPEVTFSTMLVVPCPLAMLVPVGTVQVYDVAPVIAGVE